MKLKTVSDDLLTLYRQLTYTVYKKHPAVKINTKPNKVVDAEFKLLFSSFGGYEYKRYCWEFPYPVHLDLHKAVALGYCPGLYDNVCYLPSEVAKIAHSFFPGKFESGLIIYPGYGSFPTYYTDKYIDVCETLNLEDMYTYRTAYKTLNDVKETYDVIFARPSFMGRNDMNIVQDAFEHLKPQGTLITLIKADYKHCMNADCISFRKWLNSVKSDCMTINRFCWSRSPEEYLDTVCLAIHRR